MSGTAEERDIVKAGREWNQVYSSSILQFGFASVLGKQLMHKCARAFHVASKYINIRRTFVISLCC